MKKPIKYNTEEMEFRKWCIQMAIGWPSGSYNHQMSMNIGGYPAEIDVLGRAERIYNWVNK